MKNRFFGLLVKFVKFPSTVINWHINLRGNGSRSPRSAHKLLRITPSCCQLALSPFYLNWHGSEEEKVQAFKFEQKTFLLMLMLMDLLGYEEVDWIWRGTKSKNIILIYGASVWSEIKWFSFPTKSVRDLRSKCNKISQFFSFDGSFSGETFQGRRKTSPKPNPLIAQPAQTDENKRGKTKKMCGTFSFAFLEQQSIFLILSFVVLLGRWEWVSEREKVWHVFAFRLHSPTVVDTIFVSFCRRRMKRVVDKWRRSASAYGNWPHLMRLAKTIFHDVKTNFEVLRKMKLF